MNISQRVIEKKAAESGLALLATYKYYFFITILLSVVTAVIILHYRTPSYLIHLTISNQTDNLLTHSTSPHQQPDFTRIKSRSLIRFILEQSDLLTVYQLERLFSNRDLYGNDIPYVVSANREFNYAQQDLTIENIDGSRFYLVANKTKLKFIYGQQVRFDNYNLRVLKGPAFRNRPVKVLVSSINPDELTEIYFENLIVYQSSKGLVNIDFTTPNPVGGLVFLKKLVADFEKGNLPHSTYASLTEIDDSLAKMTSHFLKDSAGLKSPHKSQMLQAEGEPDRKQLKALNAILPYVQKPVNIFNQIPNSFDLGDKVINNDINFYNDLQVQRQHFLNVNEQDSSTGKEIEHSLNSLRDKLVREINVKKANSPDADVFPVQSKKGVISADSVLKKYEELAARRNTATETTISRQFKSTYEVVNMQTHRLAIIFAALLIGILIPVPYILYHRKFKR